MSRIDDFGAAMMVLGASAMSKRDYQAFADEIAKVEDLSAKETMVRVAVAVFSQDNPRFNEASFRRACGFPERYTN